MLENSRRLVLRYETPGQFSFAHFLQSATDEELYNLGIQLNAFQTPKATRVLKVRTLGF